MKAMARHILALAGKERFMESIASKSLFVIFKTNKSRFP